MRRYTVGKFDTCSKISALAALINDGELCRHQAVRLTGDIASEVKEGMSNGEISPLDMIWIANVVSRIPIDDINRGATWLLDGAKLSEGVLPSESGFPTRLFVDVDEELEGCTVRCIPHETQGWVWEKATPKGVVDQLDKFRQRYGDRVKIAK